MQRLLLILTLLFGAGLFGTPTFVSAQTPAPALAQTTDSPSSATVATPPMNIAAGTINITGGAITLTTPPAATPTSDQAYTAQGCLHPMMRCFAVTSGNTTTFAVVAPDDRTTFHQTATDANMAAARTAALLSNNTFTIRIRDLEKQLADARRERDAALAHLASVQRAATVAPPQPQR